MPSPTPPAYAVIGATGGHGVDLRRGPGFTAIVAALSDGTIVQLTGGMTRREGFLWRRVVVPDGRVGWVAQPYLVPYRHFQAP